VQTTLLGWQSHSIIALVAALVGPYFIDWNSSGAISKPRRRRVIGAPVRVAGKLDARLLPAPSLQLRSVVVGGATTLGKVRADKLDVEFRPRLAVAARCATELTNHGMCFDLGLDPRADRLAGLAAQFIWARWRSTG